MIIGGKQVDTKRFPWYTAVFSGQGTFGGGTMIAPNIMLTAGILI